VNIDQKIIDRLNELIRRGHEIEKTKKLPPANAIGFDATVDSQAANQWYVSSKSILAKAFGKDSEHYQIFDNCFKKGVTYSPLHRGIGILMGAKEDYECGYTQDIRNLVTAELFSNLLDQASELLEAGYAGPSAVLAGAVLEDNLRKLCSINDIKLPDKPKLDYMNSQLAKADIFNKLAQKKITVIADIRNSAAHGKWSEFTPEDVADMIRWITNFVDTYLG